MNISLKVLSGTYAMFKVRTLDDLHPQTNESDVYVIAQTSDETSVICEDKYLPANYLAQSGGWKLLKFTGTLDDNLVGTVSIITTPLAKAGVSVIVSTTYDSGYFGVQEENLQKAITVLMWGGFMITRE